MLTVEDVYPYLVRELGTHCEADRRSFESCQ